MRLSGTSSPGSAQRKRLTYDALADLTGLSRTVLINLETGKTRGSLDTWHRVAHALGVPLSAWSISFAEGTGCRHRLSASIAPPRN